MEHEVSLSAIHGMAPEFLSTVALFTAPINIEEAVARLEILWSLPVQASLSDVDPSMGRGNSGNIYHFSYQGMTMMLTPVSSPLEVENDGTLPPHEFHVMITCFAPVRDASTGHINTYTNSQGETVPVVPQGIIEESARRRMAVQAHTLMVQMLDSLMREESAVGVFRRELGVVHSAQMIVELADSLSKGEAPLLLWVRVVTARPDLVSGRTFGLPLFGHLDVEITESTRTEDDVYALLSNIANYVISSDFFLLPGQTIGYRDGEKLALTQNTSPVDGNNVIRIDF
ncbi:MAG: DUF4261 domain-containing protein [Actinomycetaceae bacterium]|nr:DUF4261 domain-containing protein [Actinomycetaceae bacterium]